MAYCKPNGKEPALNAHVVETMQYERVIDQAVRDVQDLLWVNLPPNHNLPDDRTVACIRAVVAQPEIQRAIKYGDDTALSFVLRGANRILSETELPPRAILNLLWGILDEPGLNQLMGLKPSSRVLLWRKKPPAR
jgi:hypothetical protein